MLISDDEYKLLFRHTFQIGTDKSKVNLTRWFSRCDPSVISMML